MLALVISVQPAVVLAVDTPEVAELKKQNKLLTEKFEDATLKIEKLQKDIERLQKDNDSLKAEGAKKTEVAPVANAADDSPIQSSPTLKDASPKALATAAQRGASTAAADIKAGKLRILEYGGLVGFVTKDPQTGFRMLAVAGCHYNAQVQAEADAYNQVMREWHAKNLKPSTPK